MATKSTPSTKNGRNSRPKPQFYCEPCRKSFGSISARIQHLKDSPAHRQTQNVATQAPASQDQTLSLGVGLVTVKHSSSKVDDTNINVYTSNIEHDVLNEDPIAQGPWSAFDHMENPSLHRELSRHCHPLSDLRKNKYELSTYTAGDIDGLSKCKMCKRLAKDSRNTECLFHPGKAVPATKSTPRHFKCCKQSTKGCMLGHHSYQRTQHATKYKELALSPAASPKKPKFKAVVLDCEMAQTTQFKNEVILVCAVDYFTGAVLLEKLVNPDVAIRDWRASIHGITNDTMRKAVLKRTALSGWKEARAQLWQFIDQDTILVGHALHHDLDVLRMVHTRVVDSAILARNAVGMYSVQWGLQRLCEQLLGKQIRDNKGQIHDCLEDVMATREVVLWCTSHGDEFAAWGEARRVELLEKEMARKLKIGGRGKGRARAVVEEESDYEEEETSEEEILRWEDIAEDYGWPHPDTGYDPWSD